MLRRRRERSQGGAQTCPNQQLPCSRPCNCAQPRSAVLSMDGPLFCRVVRSTRQAVSEVLDAQRSRSDGQTSALGVDNTLRTFRALSVASLGKALKGKCAQSPLSSLPSSVLERICSQLPLVDRISLTHICRDLRDRTLSIPTIWQDILLDTSYPLVPLDIRQFDRLQDLVRRSGDRPLTLTVVLAPETISGRWKELSNTVHRLELLNLVICCNAIIGTTSLSDPAFWKATLDTISVPAPRLRRLSLVVVEKIPRYVPVDDDDDPEYQQFAYSSLPLSSTLFASHAPQLRACNLQGVKVPVLSPGSATFRHVTCFNYSQDSAIHIDEIGRILSLMPALVSLGLSASFLDDHDYSRIMSPYCNAGLKNLILHAERLAPEALCALIDFRGLGYVEICPGFDAGRLIAAAYPEDSMELLVLTRAGNKVVVNGEITIHTYYTFHGFHQLIEACSHVTSLALHEFEWIPGPWTTVPALPSVGSLCIRLATCAEHSLQILLAPLGSDSVGIFQASGHWELAALTRLHITAPDAQSGTCGYDDCGGRCLRDVSISLRDVAHFIRDHIRATDGRKLDELRLSGFRIVDVDAVSAQDELLALAERLQLDELAERLPYMDVPNIEDLPKSFIDRFAEES